MAAPGADEPEVHRITAAPKPHSDDMEARVGRYLLSMLIRTLCFVMMFLIDGWLRWVFAVGAIFLPYVAVIFANAGGTRRPTAMPGVAPVGPRQLTTQPFDPSQVRIYRPDEERPGDDAGTRPDDGAGPDATADAGATAGRAAGPDPAPGAVREQDPPNG